MLVPTNNISMHNSVIASCFVWTLLHWQVQTHRPLQSQKRRDLEPKFFTMQLTFKLAVHKFCETHYTRQLVSCTMFHITGHNFFLGTPTTLKLDKSRIFPVNRVYSCEANKANSGRIGRPNGCPAQIGRPNRPGSDRSRMKYTHPLKAHINVARGSKLQKPT